ncbi:MAG: TadG family pilus assembly protein [Planctomycetota bacterium]
MTASWNTSARPGRPCRRGSVLLMVVMLFPAFMLLMAIAIEFGNLSYQRSQSRTAVDAAVKAAARNISLSESKVESIIDEVLASNGVTSDVLNSLSVELGRWNHDSNDFELVQTGEELTQPANAVRIVAEVQAETTVASFFGIESTAHQVEAIATQPGIVLAVKNADTFRVNDVYMREFLTQFGVPVRVVSQGQLNASVLQSGEILFLSSSVSSGAVAASTVDANGPIVLGETNLVDLFGIVPKTPGDAYRNSPADIQSWETHGTVYANDLDVEVNLYDIDNEDDWKTNWIDWWDDEGVDAVGRGYGLFKNNVDDDGDNQVDENGEVKNFTTSNAKAYYGWTHRKYLDDATVVSTLPGYPDYVTCFWLEAGTEVESGRVLDHKFATIYTRTTEYSGSKWQYNDDGYAQLAQTIRWMLMDQKPRTTLMR